MSAEIVNGHAVIEIAMESNSVAETVRAALDPETESGPSERARAEVSVRGSNLVIEISAGDLPALRAAMNSYIAWVSACIDTIKAVTGQNP